MTHPASLRREIAIVLVLKAIGLGLIWALWFSHPMHVQPGAGPIFGPAASVEK